ncbi:MAG: hypothetical protein NTV70_22065 [Acidobacteria bacterium]|nr:hypothetical protein [Acidobacteriota bacterium]
MKPSARSTSNGAAPPRRPTPSRYRSTPAIARECWRNIQKLEAHTNHKNLEEGAIIDMTIEIRDKKHLDKILATLRRVSGVRDVNRIH